VNYENSLVVTITMTCYSWALSSGVHLFTCGAIFWPPHFQCPISWPPHGLHSLAVLDDETIDWLLYTCPEISGGQAVDWKNWFKRCWRSSLLLRYISGS